MRLDRELRQRRLLRAAMDVAERHGIMGLSHGRVADACECSSRTVYRWAPTRKVLRDRVARHARASGALAMLDAYEKLVV